MSNSTVLTVNKQNFDSNGVLIDGLTVNDVITVPYTQRTGGVAQIADTTSSPTYSAISLGGISSATYIELDSDQPISVKINGMASGFVCSGWYSATGTYTGVQVQNTSGVVANVGFDFRS